MARIGGARDYIVGFDVIFTAHLHISVEIPQIVIAKRHGARTGDGYDLAVGSNPSLHDLANRILGRLPDLVGRLDIVEPNNLILLASCNDGVIGYGAEYPSAGLQQLQLRAAVGAGAFAKVVGQCSVALPRVAALRAGDDSLCRPAADVVEAMAERMVFLRFGNMRQTTAQSCDLDLYLCLRFHGVLLSVKIGSFDCWCRPASWRQACAG